MKFDNYYEGLSDLRGLIQVEFANKRPRNWKYRRTDIVTTDEFKEIYERAAPEEATACVLFDSRYSSAEWGGWRTHTEIVFLTDNGSFVSGGYDTILSAVLPAWLKRMPRYPI